ncbi:unnamed protein product [Trichogramma brassicae]|uniref:Peptidase S1 domain-containing protein n=1 Tax=Trichogramma brassicae TaxID=86971 RepID=A0A6H5I9A6_9HYME|nr:unnamed protein product [Trichogramma brassicae]
MLRLAKSIERTDETKKVKSNNPLCPAVAAAAVRARLAREREKRSSSYSSTIRHFSRVSTLGIKTTSRGKLKEKAGRCRRSFTCTLAGVVTCYCGNLPRARRRAAISVLHSNEFGRIFTVTSAAEADSGGPFVDGKGYQIGITSFGWECGKTHVLPDVYINVVIYAERIFEVRFFAWCGRACARGGAGTTQKEDPGYVISLRSGKKTPITVRAGSDRITISRSPRRGLTKLAIDGAQHSHDDEVRSENHTHKRAPDAGAKAQLERMMAPEARTTLTR